nr:unnamed protein product [Callosobruchus chinensis]
MPDWLERWRVERDKSSATQFPHLPGRMATEPSSSKRSTKLLFIMARVLEIAPAQVSDIVSVEDQRLYIAIEALIGKNSTEIYIVLDELYENPNAWVNVLEKCSYMITMELCWRVMSSRKRNQVIEEFIEIYRQEPCLWRVKSKEYHDREKRDASYAKLLLKLKELEPDATRKSVVAKINSLRSNVRKEKKKT